MIFSRQLTAALFGGLLSIFSFGAAAQELTDEQASDAAIFAINNVRFVLYHELGHMLVDQLGLPVLGKEEDAVDSIATYSLLAQANEESDLTLTDSAYGWLLSDINAGDTLDDSDFYDEHSLDLQRAYAIVCLIVGSDGEGFADVADEYGMDPDRQESCAYDYGQMEASLIALLSPYLGVDSGIQVAYDEPLEDYAWAPEMLKNSGILEAAAADFGQSFALPSPVTVRATQCGQANAFYDPETIEVNVCYELLDEYINMIVNDMLAEK